ncbi:2-oxo acid dehydrogenase subunit E2 [Herbaspirillum frisingense]|uniref:2-oxo acid dehydrogenase subunit E2 n=1 Tax=Herbaspirillum frisingense TaxID=92645 RepID=UPI001F418B98|nr:2-oxo acid dehydrogenase subunit E2 [Herbaspirillum frisingense]UIN21201.1 2-oxo acid dehydrogenase subunit E2 [Herbaspirillum frisingense]
MKITIPFTPAGDAVRVVELMVKPGDLVSKGESLFAVENHKSIFDVPSNRSGVISSIQFKEGDVVQNNADLVRYTDETVPPSGNKHQMSHEILASSPYILSGQELKLTEISVSPGDFVEENGVIASISSESAIVDVLSTKAGLLVGFHRRVGDKIAHAEPLASLQPMTYNAYLRRVDAEESRTVSIKPTPPVESLSVSTSGAPLNSEVSVADNLGSTVPIGAHLTPSQRASLRREGSVSARNATSAEHPSESSASNAQNSPSTWPKVDFTKFGPIDLKPLSRIQKISGANLHRNWLAIPHVTNNEEADITDLDELRLTLNKEHEKAGLKFTMLAFVIKAVASALKKFPDFNASLDGDNIILKHYYHIGFAADTPKGLVVPVIRDVDTKGLVDIAKEMTELSKLAREGKLKPDQMLGGCFSISSLGGIGGTHFTPIINAPEVAILGLSRSYQKPVWDGKEFVPRLTLPMSLSFDHRVIDGAAAARFNAYLSTILTDFRRIIL